MPALATSFSQTRGHGNASTSLADVFRDLTRPAGDYAIIVLLPNGRIASWNSAAEHIFGFDVEHVIHRDFGCLYPREDVEAGVPERDLARALEKGTTHADETCRRRSDGTLFSASVHLSSVFDQEGSHLGFVQLVQNKERHTSPAQKYAETIAKADLVLRSVQDSIYVQDASGTMLYANDAAARGFGLPDGPTLMRTPLEEVVPTVDVFDERGNPVDLLDMMRTCDERRESGRAALYYTRERWTDESRWWLERYTTLNDEQGRPELVISVATDVTDTVRSKEAARSLAETTRLLTASLDYETTLRNLADALVPQLADWASVLFLEDGTPRQVALSYPDTEIAARVRTAWRSLGKGSELPTPLATVFRTGRAQLHADVTPEMLQAFATTEDHLAALRRIRIRSIILVPIIVRERTEGVLALCTIEPRRQYDRADLELATEIGRRAGTAIEHTHLYRDAQRAVRLRDEFLSVAAHELRTPLASLTLQLQSIKAAIAGTSHPEGGGRFEGRIDKTLRQSNRLTRLVDGLLDVSQIAIGQVELHREEIDLRTVVNDVCTRFAEDAERAGSELSVSSSGPCIGSWDADRLDQVVCNLLSNALKYGQGKPVTVQCDADERQASVTVTDRGIGIAPENLRRIFGRFERGVSERNYGGLGLGLWIAQEIAQAHGGRVDVESSAGEGAVFRLI
ncbi:MAG TPA: PAS domain-containing sensor histidine kinase, partial [Labilithrix sp.]|nr:PAS domain-containing sensor histidine kinase [Labilithrix sp.]